MRPLRLAGASLLTAILFLSLGMLPQPALALDIIIDGTAPFTCDQSGLATAVNVAAQTGGTVTFACSDNVIEMDQQIQVFPGTLTIDGSNIDGPQIILDGQGSTRILTVPQTASLKLQDLTLQNGSVAITEIGGAITNAGNLTIDNCIFDSNHSDNGGAIGNFGTLTISQSTFSSNSSRFIGGAIDNLGGTLTISQSSFNSNSTTYGGGAIYNTAGQLTVSQSTFSMNSAIQGGAMYAQSGPITLLASTLTGNVADTGSALHFSELTSGSTVAWSTIIQPENTGPSLYINHDVTLEGAILGGEGDHCDTVDGAITDTYTLANDDSCNLSGDGSQQGIADLGLDIDNPGTLEIGGVVQTYYPPMASSPALDGPDTCDTDILDDPDPDQIGNPRPSGATCEIGAVEAINIATASLCANTWTGQLRVSDDCGRSETLVELPADGPITLCVNQWNGATQMRESCVSTEQTITATGDHTIPICIDQWTSILRVVDQCTRTEVADLL